MNNKIARNFSKYRTSVLVAILLLELAFFAVYRPHYSIGLFGQNEAALQIHDRILVLAPHPDDEILGCGGIIQRAVKMNIPVKVVFLTYGDNNQWSFLVYRKHFVFMPKAVRSMGLIRREEAITASAALGLSSDNLIFLGYPDFKTLNIWYAYWGKTRPAVRSMLTKVWAVPYENAFHPGAPYKGEEILGDLEKIIRSFKPTKIFVSHPADFNADHKSFYLFTRVALWDLAGDVKATIHPYLVHYKNWPLPRGYHPLLPLAPPECYKKQIDWKINVLTQDEIKLNRLAIQKHRSQYSSTAAYLLTFIRSPELFGDFPDIVVRQGIENKLIVSDEDNEPQTLPRELTDKERDSFVGIEERSAFFVNNNLVISIQLSSRIGKAAGLSLYAFGYRKDKPFMDMPKIRIRFGTMGHKVLDQNKRLLHARVIVKKKKKKM
ncbi:MAG: PIG-L family deacetylase, partial [Candidatus Omnitrophica bacterium]|nr:PIG-L family deacetylase [Candidatus Omnitrophota bacterium]